MNPLRTLSGDPVRVVVIILAAGSGTRMKSEVNKHLLPLAGKPVIVHTLEAFQRCAAIDAIVLVTSAENQAAYQALITEHNITKVGRIVLGGDTRQVSAYKGLRAADDCDIILLHDGARPLIAQREIEAVIRDAAEYGGAVVAVPAKDTTVLGREGFIEAHLERGTLWQVQTPQGFKAAIINEAYEAAARDGVQSTDDTGLVTRLGGRVKITPGSYANIKITTPEDLAMAEALLGKVGGKR
jgi:2-C-methyl-D-erythritol 4-phosphate cytidylyltransferase